ncbi:phosphotransferase family protein [Nocardia puris]|uniref:Phosphotransferase family enzyme n=1 Tax=Nocardia puris TaxID=208602 RepID=A0A366DV07_9NOCA|nr:aminoglycoside phosphotransferase family protein [Nocardia puris]RBO93926.1 phosphotransferase family enzyme [Nocardia puris]
MDVLDEHRSLLTCLLPDDAVAECEVRQGQFHHVVLGRDRVVCFPRTEAAAARLPARAAVLRALSGLGLGVATPEPIAESEEPAYLVLTRIPGQPLPESALSRPGAPEAVARQLAELLSSLASAGTAPLPEAPADRWEVFADEVRAGLFPLMSAAGRVRATRELDALDTLPHLTTAIVHGDLGGENLLWDTGNPPRLLGVVDWDDACLGDPAEDLAALSATYPPAVLEPLLALLGTDPPTRTRIATLRATFALQQALSAHRDGDEEELADGLAGYR